MVGSVFDAGARMYEGGAEGVWPCTFVGECSVVCPKQVDPAGAIQRYKVSAAADWIRSLLLGRKP